jgi:nitrogen-specific signal transduction histidine kinase
MNGVFPKATLYGYFRNSLFEKKWITVVLAISIGTTLLIGSIFVSQRLRAFSIREAESRVVDTARLVNLVFDNICNNAEVALDVANLRLANVNNSQAVYAILKGLPLAKHVVQITDVGPDGRVIASNLTDKSGVDLSDRAHIRVQLDKSHVGTYVSVPVIGRISGNKTIQLTKRYLDERGHIARILVLSYSFNDLVSQFESVNMGPGSAVAIVGDDGLVRLRLERDRNHALHISSGQDVEARGVLQTHKSSRSGAIMQKSPIDGIFRIGGFFRSDAYGTYAFAAISDDFAMSASTKLTSDLAKVLVVVTMLSAFLVAIVIAVQSAQSRRRAVMAVRSMESEILRRISRMSDITIATVSDGKGVEFLESAKDDVASRHAIKRYIEMNIEPIVDLFKVGEPNQIYRFSGDDDWHEVCISCDSVPDFELDGSDKKIIFALDQTEHRKHANRLYHVSKLAAIGELAAGMAHEIHQPLSTIRFSLTNARVAIEQGNTASVVQRFQTVDRQIDKIKSLIDHLRYFSRPSDDCKQKKHLDIFAIVESACDLIRYQYKESGIDIIVCKRVSADSGFLVGDPNGIEQVILNILQNAKYAIEHRHHNEGESGRIEICVSGTADHITVAIRDNGGGIAVKNISKIFEPFFSNKPFDEGGGLGLSICKDILQEHGGSIEAENVEGGACFYITLPLVKLDEVVTVV